jgi:acyl carrier protein
VEVNGMGMNRDEILAKVRETLVDALGVDEDEVQATSTLTGDLGAESIDFLDIVFRLEKAFGIQIPRGELFPDNILNNAEFVENGKVTAKGLEELKKRMPHADFGDFEKNPDINHMPDLFTVTTIVNYIDRKVNS